MTKPVRDLETKEAGSLPIEVKDAFDRYQRTIESLRTVNDERIKGIEKKFDDVVTVEKFDRVASALEELKSQINEQIAALQRGAGEFDERDEAKAMINDLRQMERKAFDRWVRRGDAYGLQQAAQVALSDNYRDLAKKMADATGIEIKDLSTVVAQDGGYLVQPQVEMEMIEIIEELSDIRQIAGVMEAQSGEVEVPVDKGGFEAAWVSELAERARTATGQVEKRKFIAEEIYALPKVTLKMLEDATGFDVESWLMKKVTRAIARKEGQAFISGDGNQKPKGFLSQSIVADTSWVWGSLGYRPTGAASGFAPSVPGASPSTPAANGADVLIDLVYSLPRAYRANCDWVMNRKTLRDVRKLKDGDGAYLFKDALTQSGIITMLLGYPVLEAEDMPDIAANTFPIAFGDFQEGYQIIDRTGLMIKRDDVTSPGFVIFHFRRRVGGDVSDFQAIKLLKVATS